MPSVNTVIFATRKETTVCEAWPWRVFFQKMLLFARGQPKGNWNTKILPPSSVSSQKSRIVLLRTDRVTNLDRTATTKRRNGWFGTGRSKEIARRVGVARGKAKHRGENGGGRGPKGRWNHGRAPRAADHLSLSRIFHRGSQGNCFLRFIVLFRLTGAMISLLVLYSSRQYRAIMAAYLLPFFSPFPSSSERNDPSTFHPPPLFFLRIHPSRFLLPVYRTYFFSRERGREGGSLLSKARHLREKGGCSGWLGW